MFVLTMKREKQNEKFSQDQIMESRKYLRKDMQMLMRKWIIGLSPDFLKINFKISNQTQL